MLKEFKEFALKGNVVDLAVGIIIGAAFNGIVKSLVDDIIMPPLGLIVGSLDFSDLGIILSRTSYDSLAAAQEAGVPVLRYGQFLNNVLNFLIVAFAVFLLVRQINRLRRSDTPPTPNTKPCPYCTEIIPLKATRCPQCTSPLDVVGRSTV